MESLNNDSVNERNFHLRVYSQVSNLFHLHQNHKIYIASFVMIRVIRGRKRK